MTEHAVEHAIVALFIWGIVDIVWKFLSFPREIRSSRYYRLPPRQGRESTASAAHLLQLIAQKPALMRGSKAGNACPRPECDRCKGARYEDGEYLLYLA